MSEAEVKGRKKVAEMNAEEKAAYDKRVAAARGPRPLHIAHKIVDENGNVIVGAKLAGVVATRNANELLGAIAADRDLQYTTIEVK